jgi:hypothetical protein
MSYVIANVVFAIGDDTNLEHACGVQLLRLGGETRSQTLLELIRWARR